MTSTDVQENASPGPSRRELRRLAEPVRGFVILVQVVIVMALCACSGADGGSDGDDIITTLRIAVLPDLKAEDLQLRYGPLVEYLGHELDMPCELIVTDSYEDFVNQFREREFDLGYFGGFTYVAARDRSAIVPIALRGRDLRFSSYFLVRRESSARSLLDLRGTRLAFGSELSTSGHLMPRHDLRAEGIEPESFFAEIRHTGAHDATAIAVRDGVVDVGVVNSLIIEAMFRDGRLSKNDVRILYETRPYSNYVWAMRADTPAAVQVAVRDAFLKLTPEEPDHLAVLECLDAEVLLPASDDDFETLAGVVDELHLLDDLP